jgi:uncharacterized membrane protein
MTTKIKSTDLFTIKQICVLGALLGYLAWTSVPGLLQEYSLWRDEIFTAAFISDTWGTMLSEWIGPDVHPPLYFVMIKTWSAALGTSELALRGFSFVFSVATLLLLWFNWCQTKRLQRLLSLLFIAANSSFLYYSQEARSYSLVLFLSIALLLRTMDSQYLDRNVTSTQRQNAILTYGLCITLSLTHYFGFILAGTVLVIDCWKPKISGSVRRSIETLVLVMLWPTFHVGVLGQLGDVQREQLGNLAGTITPVWGTLETYVYSCLHFIHSGITPLNILMSTLLFLPASYYLTKARVHSWSQAKHSYSDFSYSASIILIVLSFLVAIDPFWPISTSRNLIILLFPTSILFGTIFEGLLISPLKTGKQFFGLSGLTSIALILLLSSKISTANLTQKINYQVDYKSLAAFVRKEKICMKGCSTLDYDPNGNQWGDRIDDYYFSDLNLVKYEQSANRSIPIIGSLKIQEEINTLANAYPEATLVRACKEPINENQRTPFILVPQKSKIRPDQRSCIPRI